MSDSLVSKSAPAEESVAKKQKQGDEHCAPSSASSALLLSSFGFGSAGVKSHMEDAHVMFDECVHALPPRAAPQIYSHYTWFVLAAASGQCSRPA
jgi:hypothetical protein